MNFLTSNNLSQVFRHGARTPADTFPTDPHINNTMEPYGWGELTNVNIPLNSCKL